MRIGVVTVLLRDLPLAEALDYLAQIGVQDLEIGCGGYPGNDHCDAAELLASDDKRSEFQEAITSRGLKLSALAVHGNPLHPDTELASRHAAEERDAIRLAEKLGVETVVGFSGCPGDHEGAKYPNWVTNAWPTDYPAILTWQWDTKVIPYWREAVAFARDHGITRIALEMHPGFVVYNPETLMRLRDAVGPEIGANVDPSHLFWQGVDVPEAILDLGRAGAIYHFHAKDTRIEPTVARKHGVLDTKSLAGASARAWIFRTVGYGHGAEVWRDIVTALRTVNYDGPLSIEHEDSLMSPREGLEKAVRFLREIIIEQPASEAYWA